MANKWLVQLLPNIKGQNAQGCPLIFIIWQNSILRFSYAPFLHNVSFPVTLPWIRYQNHQRNINKKASTIGKHTEDRSSGWSLKAISERMPIGYGKGWMNENNFISKFRNLLCQSFISDCDRWPLANRSSGSSWLYRLCDGVMGNLWPTALWRIWESTMSNG